MKMYWKVDEERKHTTKDLDLWTETGDFIAWVMFDDGAWYVYIVDESVLAPHERYQVDGHRLTNYKFPTIKTAQKAVELALSKKHEALKAYIAITGVSV
jgi:hypothetical protein